MTGLGCYEVIVIDHPEEQRDSRRYCYVIADSVVNAMLLASSFGEPVSADWEHQMDATMQQAEIAALRARVAELEARVEELGDALNYAINAALEG